MMKNLMVHDVKGVSEEEKQGSLQQAQDKGSLS
jgi:hypothetical protein